MAKQKIPGKRGIWGNIWLGGHRSDAVRMRPNRRVSRGDGGGVRGWRGVVLAYNFLLEGKTYIRIRRAFHLREPSDIGIQQAVTKKMSQPFFFVVTPKNGDFDVLFSRSYFTRLSNRFTAVGLFLLPFFHSGAPALWKK